MTVRFLLIAGILALALGLVGITLTLAQDTVPDDPGQSESEREVAAAAALEANPPLAPRATSIFTPPTVITAPLLVGVSENNEFVYLVDPVSSTNQPLFDGDEVWGAAFDHDNQTLYYVHGPTLVSLPFDGSPATSGSIVGGTSGDLLSIVGLAYHDGLLYGSRITNSAADPEGIYTIDPTTLSATLLLTYNVAISTVDIGGIAVDPATGDLYGTNDTLPQRGLVKIGLDGSLEVITPYPTGENDLDGLAIGDGRAYLVPDQPGSIYVFDLATLAYTVPLTNPWTTNELFSAGAWLAEAPVLTPTITLTKTVGTDPGLCATTPAITVTAGTEVYYCYEVTNTGGRALARHSLDDSELGNLLNDFVYTLAPAASAFITESAVISSTTVNTATWTAFNPGPTDVVTATAVATVNVPEPAITLSKTVGTDPNVCATTSTITVDAGSDVTYCYEVTNTGPLTVTRHTLEDSELGTLLNDFAYTLPPGDSAFITETATITQTTINTATWTAYNPGPLDVASATAVATVNLPEPAISLAKTVGTDPNDCAETTAISVTAGTDVTYCYEVTNTGPLTVTRHTLEDSELGTLLNALPYTLSPGASTFVTETATITQTTVNTATWTAYNPGPIDVAAATASASVTVPTVAPEADIVVTPTSISAQVLVNGQTTRTVTIGNDGDAELAWSLSYAPTDCASPGVLLWVSADQSGGTTTPGEEDEITLTFTGIGSQAGTLDGFLCVMSNDPDEAVVAVSLSLTVGDAKVYLSSVFR